MHNLIRDRRSAGDLFAYLALLIAVVGLFQFSLAELVSNDDPTRHAGLGDMHTYLGPSSFFFDISIREGDVPLWNPQTYAGMPFAAHPMSMAFYPPNLVRSALTRAETPRDTLISLHRMSLFHLLVMAAGLYALTRREGMRLATGFAVALVVPFSRNWLQQAIYFNYALSACAWIPLILVCFHEALGQEGARRRSGWLAFASLLYGLQILSGYTQIAIYATLIYVAYVVLKLAARAREEQLGLAWTARRILLWAGLLAAFGAAGVCVAAVGVAPALEFVSLSARATENFESFTSTSSMINMSTWTMVRLMIENAQPGFEAKWLAVASMIENLSSLNVGGLIAAFAAALATRLTGPVVYGLLLYGLVDLIVGMPMPLAIAFDRLIPVETSSPMYGTLLIAIPMGILAGFGVDAVIDRVQAGSLRWGHGVYLVLAAGVSMALVHGPPAADSGDTAMWLLLPVAVAVLLIASRGIPRALLALVVALLLLEVALSGRAYVEELFRRPILGYAGTARELDATPRKLGATRVIASSPNRHLWSGVSAINGYDPLSLAWVIPQLSNPGLENTYDRIVAMGKNPQAAALLKRRFWLVPAFVRGKPPEKSRLYPPASAVFLSEQYAGTLPEVTLEQLPASTLTVLGDEVEIWTPRPRRNRARAQFEISPPRRHSALIVNYRTANAATLDVAISGDDPREEFSLRKLELPASPPGGRRLEIPLPDFAHASVSLHIRSALAQTAAYLEQITMASDSADEIEQIYVAEISPDHVVLNLRDLTGPRMLVFTDAHYPGWAATLDGTPVRIELANGAFKAVEVPAGDHQLRFDFEPRTVRAGLTVSLAALLAGLPLLVWAFRGSPGSVQGR